MQSQTPDQPTHTLSINIYGRGDTNLGDGPSHMGIAVYKHDDASTCEIHHIRNPTDETFIYDPRRQPLDTDPVLMGRCEPCSFTTETKNHINNLLSSFRKDTSNIPLFGAGNCQNWVAGAVGMLEAAGVLGDGEGVFWDGMIGLSAREMEGRCVRSGRKWIPGLGSRDSRLKGDPDARFGGRGDAERCVGRLMQNPALRERMEALLGVD